MASDLIYKSRVKDLIKDKGLLCDGDLPQAASEKLNDLIEEAAERAQANGRKTVRPEDL
ncbi:MAG: histone-like protein [bacterium]